MLFNDTGYIDLVGLGMSAGLLFAMLMSFTSKTAPIDIVKHVLIGAVMFFILIVPKSNVTIIDKSYLPGSTGTMTVSNVPTFLAALAHSTSLLGIWLDEKYITYLAPLPEPGASDEIKKAGTHMTRKLMTSTLLAEPRNAIFLENFSSYTRECLAYDLNSGHKDLDSIMNAPDTWTAIGDTNPAVFLAYKTALPGGGFNYEIKNCLEAYVALGVEKNKEADNLFSTHVSSIMGGGAASNAMLANLTTDSMAQFMKDTTRSAAEHYRNIVAQNVLLKSIGELNGEPLAVARAIVGVEAGASQKADLAKSFIYTITIVQLLAYIFFPIIALIVIISGMAGLKGLIMIVKVLVWLALVQASQVIIDNFILINSINEARSYVGTGMEGSINAFRQAGGIINGMESQLQNALFASLALSWMMLQASTAAGSQIASALFGGAQTYNERTATDSAAEGRQNFGDVKWQNASYSNDAAHSYSTSPTTVAGTLSTTGADGVRNNYNANGISSDYSAIHNSGTPLTAQAITQMVKTFGQQGARLTEKADQYGVAAAMQEQKTRQHAYAAIDGSVISKAHGSGLTFANETNVSNAVEQARARAKELTQGTSFSEDQVRIGLLQGIAQLGAEGKGGAIPLEKIKDYAKGFSANAGLSAQARSSFDEKFAKSLQDMLKSTDTTTVKDIATLSDKIANNKDFREQVVQNDTANEQITSSADRSAALRIEESSSRREAKSFIETYQKLESYTQSHGYDLTSIIGDKNTRDLNMDLAGFRKGGSFDHAKWNKILNDEFGRFTANMPTPQVIDGVPRSGADVGGANSEQVKAQHEKNTSSVVQDDTLLATPPSEYQIKRQRVNEEAALMNWQLNSAREDVSSRYSELSDKGKAELKEYEKLFAEHQQRLDAGNEKTYSGAARFFNDMGAIGLGGVATVLGAGSDNLARIQSGNDDDKNNKPNNTSDAEKKNDRDNNKAEGKGGRDGSKKGDDILENTAKRTAAKTAAKIPLNAAPVAGQIAFSALSAADMAYETYSAIQQLKEIGVIDKNASPMESFNQFTSLANDYMSRKF